VKPRRSNQRNHALTLTEVLVVIAVLALLIVVFFPWPSRSDRGITKRISYIICFHHLGSISLAFRMWAGDHNDKYPMEISTANGGTMELAATGDAVATFQVMSNELATPLVLFCVTDTNHILATNFGVNFTAKNVSYFVGLDADTNRSQAFLSGDSNITIGSVPVKSGLLELSTNSPVAWTSERHVLSNSHFWTPAKYKYVGNIGFADGSVRGQVTQNELRQALQQTGLATNRLAIP
jgi:prepilin-type N-terminal cleavage/methylation domain-containing protein/prepilin-type processing-associated H-X9-DG protein